LRIRPTSPDGRPLHMQPASPTGTPLCMPLHVRSTSPGGTPLRMRPNETMAVAAWFTPVSSTPVQQLGSRAGSVLLPTATKLPTPTGTSVGPDLVQGAILLGTHSPQGPLYEGAVAGSPSGGSVVLPVAMAMVLPPEGTPLHVQSTSPGGTPLRQRPDQTVPVSGASVQQVASPPMTVRSQRPARGSAGMQPLVESGSRRLLSDGGAAGSTSGGSALVPVARARVSPPAGTRVGLELVQGAIFGRWSSTSVDGALAVCTGAAGGATSASMATFGALTPAVLAAV